MISLTLKKIEKNFDLKKWSQARKLILKELKKKPNNHWYLTRLSTTYYEEKKYKKALILSQKAYQIAPDCPLVLWDMGGSLYMLKHYSLAIQIWKKLLLRGIHSIAYNPCGEGKKQARSLLNDCRYRIGNAFLKMGRKKEAEKYYKLYIKHRNRLTPSIYNLGKVKIELSKF